MSSVLILISKLIHRRSDIYANLGISSFVILFTNPYSILNLSFILSYSGILGIIIYNIIQEKYLVKVHQKLKNIKCKIMRSFISYIINSFIISICIQIVTIPILINNFHSISLIGIIVNVCATPILTAIISVSLISTIISYVCMPMAMRFGDIINFLVNFLTNIVNIGATMPFTEILCTRISTSTMTIYYMMLAYIIYLIKINRIHIIKHFIRKNANIMIILVLIINIFNFIEVKCITIDFIDVGQGDATLIKTPSNKIILIDGGGKEANNNLKEEKKYKDEVGEKILLPHLLNQKVKLIDYIIVSHFDLDHVRFYTIFITRDKSEKHNNRKAI